MLVEGNRRRGVIHVPAEAAVVEVDHFHRLAVDQQIGEAKITMDQAKAFR